MLRQPALRKLEAGSLDKLYLDNTFFDPHFREFPSHAVSVVRGVSIVRAHPRHRVVFATDMLGKEELLHDIGLVRAVVVHGVRSSACVVVGCAMVLRSGLRLLSLWGSQSLCVCVVRVLCVWSPMQACGEKISVSGAKWATLGLLGVPKYVDGSVFQLDEAWTQVRPRLLGAPGVACRGLRPSRKQ
jgi:hypothetical protein